jgi:hypothetical protein
MNDFIEVFKFSSLLKTTFKRDNQKYFGGKSAGLSSQTFSTLNYTQNMIV